MLSIALDLLRFRQGPQALPYSFGNLMGLIAMDVGLGLLALYWLSPQAIEPARVLVLIALQFGLPSLALHLAGQSSRIVKTLSALALVDLVFTVLLIPLMIVLIPMAELDPKTVKPNLLQVLAVLLWLGLHVWQLLVNGFLYRHALNWPWLIGIALALMFFVISQGVDTAFFAPPAKAPTTLIIDHNGDSWA